VTGEEGDRLRNRLSPGALTVYRQVPQAKVVMQRDSRGTVRVLFGLRKGPANLSLFFKSRGYDWVWQGPRSVAALQEQILPGGRPLLPPGSTSKVAFKHLASRDAMLASKLSAS